MNVFVLTILEMSVAGAFVEFKALDNADFSERIIRSALPSRMSAEMHVGETYRVSLGDSDNIVLDMIPAPEVDAQRRGLPKAATLDVVFESRTLP